ncbi:MAG: protein kinase [Myxococcota bacterium]
MTDSVTSFAPLGDRFDVRETLGSGSSGTVYRAHDHVRNEEVAVKVLHNLSPASVLRFKREFRSLAELRHPNLLRLHELVSRDGGWLLVMELVPGVSITEAVAAGPIEIGDAFRQLARALSALHAAGQVHRDLKPSNILVNPAGRLVLLDFGFVTDLDGTVSTHLVGTPLYASPEQIQGEATEASDWYSFGTVLFEALTRTTPFSGRALEVMARKQQQDAPPVRDLAPNAPAALARLADRLLAREPEARPAGLEVLRGLSAEDVERPGELVLVGRDEELAALTAAFERAKEGRPVLAWIEGTSGIGKTALLRAFTDKVRSEAWVLAGRCYQQESVPHKALDGIIDHLSHRLMGLDEAALTALGRDEVFKASALFPVLARLPRISGGEPAEAIEPRRRREIAIAALRRLFERLGKNQPLVLCADDLHWGDADSAALLGALTEDLEGVSMLFVGAFRKVDRSSSPFLSQLPPPTTHREVIEVPLAPLSRAGSHTLARVLLPDGEPSHIAAIADEAGGHPFLLGQLARYGSAAYGLRATDVLERRAGSLEPDARRLLMILSIARRPIAADTLRRVLGLERPLAGLMDDLRQQRWIQLRGDGPTFVETYHDRIAETFRASLSQAERAEIHSALADALIGHDTGPEALAVHLEEAGRHEEASRYVTEAGHRAAMSLAWDAAVRLYQRARTLADRADRDLEIALGHALAGAGRGLEAVEIYRHACRGADPPLLRELELRIADQLLRAGYIDEGYRAIDIVLRSIGTHLQSSPRAAIASLLYHRAALRVRGLGATLRSEADIDPAALREIDVLWSAGVGMSFVDSPRGADFLARSLLAALRAGEPRRLARSVAYEACYVSNRGWKSREPARMLIERARTIASDLDDPYLHTLVEGSSCIAAFHAGGFRRCVAHAERAVELFHTQVAGHIREVASLEFFWLTAKVLLGELTDVHERLPRLLRAAAERGDRFSTASFRTGYVNLVWLAEDDPTRAQKEAETAMNTWTQDGFHVQHFLDLVARTSHDLYVGDAEAAAARVRTTWSRFRRSLLPRLEFVRVAGLELRARAELAALHQRRWNRAAREKQLWADIRKLRQESPPRAQAHATLLAAGVHRLHEPAEAVADYAEAAVMFEAIDMVLHSLVARRAALVAQGRPATAEEEALRARGIHRPSRFAQLLAPGS